ncbi:MAG TPA: deoxynucleoside kinase [Chloroflexi bacterium]|jgi:deoxyadenosine/deoxycytidine kinase|nr:deoxynucleoside kinase [Chloroflexota bacterium]
MDRCFIAIAGNIGVGKSTLTEVLSRALGARPFFEAVDANPYLADFYRDMRTWSFHSQVFFLSQRLRRHYELTRHLGTVIQDRTVYEDAEVFARNLYDQGLMSPRDYRVYRQLYEVMRDLVPPPTLVVYLRASVETLLQRIALRGRPYEHEIGAAYLEQLNALYEEWVAGLTLCPVLVIETDAIDFVHRDDDTHAVVRQVLSRVDAIDAAQCP